MNDLTSIVYETKYKTKNTVPDTKILVFMTGFFVGLVFFYFAGKQLIEDSGFLSKEYLDHLKQFSIKRQEYLLYIAGIRIKQFLFVLFCTLTVWAGYLLYVALGYAGFQLGILFFAAMYQYGMRGVFYCIFMILPHGIFYFLTYIKIWNRKLGSDKKYFHKDIDINYNKAKKVYKNVKDILSILVLLCLGILSESYINPWLMKWILMFF